MRQVATIPDERHAQRLADYLLTREISTRLDPSAAGWIVWIHREEKLDQARREVAEFLADPDNPRYDGVGKAAEAARRAAAKRERQHLRNTVSLQGRLNAPSPARCPVTYTLIALSIAVAILTRFGRDPGAVEPLLLSPTVETYDEITLPQVDPDEPPIRIQVQSQHRSTGLSAVKRGQVWRLFTPILLHFGIMHLAFNMIMFYQLGCLIEMRKGKLAMLGVVLVAAILSNLGEYEWDLLRHGPDYPVRFGGMSGVVYALFGYCWMKSEYDPEADIRIPTNMIVWMMLWLVFCMTGALGPIANAAHVAGLGVGMLVGLVPHLGREWRWW